MKLTKGKISKLYTKNRQSVKKRKNGKKKTYKSKTFRKNKRGNLFNKTLKHLYGGEPGIEMTNLSDTKPVDEELNQDVPVSSVPPASDFPVVEDSTVVGDVPGADVPVVEDVPLADAPGADVPVVEDVPLADAPGADVPVVEDVPLADAQVENSTVVDGDVPLADAQVENSTVVDGDVPLADAQVEDSTVVEDVPVSDGDVPVVEDSTVVEDVPVSDGDVPVVEDSTVVEDVPVVEDSTVADVPIETQINNNPTLQTAVDNLGKEISNQVLKVVSEQLSNNISTVTNNIQNGFNSNQLASETMASTGGKRHRTGKFRLTNKNKHKKTKKHKK